MGYILYSGSAIALGLFIGMGVVLYNETPSSVNRSMKELNYTRYENDEVVCYQNAAGLSCIKNEKVTHK